MGSVNKKIVISIATFVTTSFILGCGTVTSKNELNKKYRMAIADTAQASHMEIHRNLYAVNEKNKELIWSEGGSKILAVSWMSEYKYNNFYKNKEKISDKEEHATWVTLVPQVNKFCRDYLERKPKATKQEVDLRLKQYLGLPHEGKYDVFVEVWVSHQDIFRPCVDIEIHDHSCNLHFEEGKIPEVDNINKYDEYYKKLRNDAYPWTGLGYTYDWGNPDSEVGASEYILSPGSKYIIGRVMQTVDYCTMSY
uniref:Lipoprotein n=1 Tax=Candidatus Kentrum sp. LFY TaxID=2126342 RepID=A0A450W7I7_9GAMM|nr:MAG: hypothetical protein BECKLFY1418C_GA0070996_100212 [Candidatus Kentron sp. LFY]